MSNNEKLIEEAVVAMVHSTGRNMKYLPEQSHAHLASYARAALAVFEKAHTPVGVVAEEPEWEYAPAFKEEPDLAIALISRDIAQREVDGWNQARRRTLARESRDIGESILVRRRKAGLWVPVNQEGADA